MDSGIRKVLLAQLLLGSIAILGFAVAGQGLTAALGAGFGAAVTMSNGVMMHWRLRRAAVSGSDRGSLLHILLGALERFGLAIVALSIGIGLLKLPALPVVVGFALAQLGFMVGGFANRAEP
jgi:ATP synthase protein I